MATLHGGLAIDGCQQEQERPVSRENPSPFRYLTSSLNKRLTTAFGREENVDVPDIPDFRQPVVRIHTEELGSRLLQKILATANSD